MLNVLELTYLLSFSEADCTVLVSTVRIMLSGHTQSAVLTVKMIMITDSLLLLSGRQ